MLNRRKIKYPLFVIALGLTASALIVHARRDTLIGQWQAHDTNVSGASEIVTARFSSDGLMTLQSQATQGTLLHSTGIPAALFPTVSRVNMQATYTTKKDVLSVQTVGMRMMDSQGRPVTLPVQTNYTRTVYRYTVQGDTLTLDQLNGTPPTVLTRQHT